MFGQQYHVGSGNILANGLPFVEDAPFVQGEIAHSGYRFPSTSAAWPLAFTLP